MAAFWLLLLLVASAIHLFRTWRARSIVSKARQAAGPTYSPGMEPYPLIGHLPQFVANRHRVLDWMTDEIERQATCTFVLRRPGGVRGAITANPANVEHFLRTSFDRYPKGPRFSSLLHDFLGRGIFNADGEAWRAQRKVASHEFNTRSLRAFVARCVHAELHGRLLPLLRRAAAAGAPLDLQDTLERFAFDNICRVAFDHDPRQLPDDGDDDTVDSSFADAFRDAANLSAGRFRYAVPWFWKIKKALNVGSEKRLRESIAMVHDFADRIIQSRREEMLSARFEKHDLLSRFMASQDETYSKSEVPLRDVVISFLLAGRETTSSALTWFFWLLSSRPDVQRRIRDEVAAVRARRAQGDVDSVVGFDLDELREMHYLHAALTESMRAGAAEHAACGDGRRAARRHSREGGVVRGVQFLCDGADGVGLGRRRAGVPAGAVARPRRRDVPAGQPVPVRGIPRGAQALPGQGDGVHPDEVHRGVRGGGARRRGGRSLPAQAGCGADAADGGRAPGDREAETGLTNCCRKQLHQLFSLCSRQS